VRARHTPRGEADIRRGDFVELNATRMQQLGQDGAASEGGAEDGALCIVFIIGVFWVIRDLLSSRKGDLGLAGRHTTGYRP